MVKYIVFFVALFVVSCKSERTEPQPDQPFTVDSFTEFPPEIDGCSCYFANDSIEFNAEKYIYMNDFAETSFVKINDTLIKFKQISHNQIDSLNTVAKYRSTNYNMILKVKDKWSNGYETYLNEGTIEITDKNGRTVTLKFYGECGC